MHASLTLFGPLLLLQQAVVGRGLILRPVSVQVGFVFSFCHHLVRVRQLLSVLAAAGLAAGGRSQFSVVCLTVDSSCLPGFARRGLFIGTLGLVFDRCVRRWC